MRSEIISALESEYARRRQENERKADLRWEEAERDIPGLAEALRARQELIFGGVRNILNQEDPGDIPGRMRDLNARVEALLEGAGRPKDWLDPIYTCAKCRDTGYVGQLRQEMCACMKSELYRRLAASLGLDEREEQSFETWDAERIPDAEIPGMGLTQRQLSALLRDEARDWTRAWPDTPVQFVVLSGESGLGKTFLMHAMAKELIRRERNVLLVSAYTALDQARRAAFDREEEGLESLLEADVLMVDDFGSEPLLNNVTVEQFFNLFSERQRRGLATVVSTNLTPNGIKERYTERVASRLLDSRRCLLLLFRGKDIRKPQGLKETR